MAVVIDEMESTVEPEATRGQPAAESGGQTGGGGQQNIGRNQLASELNRIARRQARLRAD